MGHSALNQFGRPFSRVAIAWALAAITAWSAEPFRTFRDTKDRSFEGKVAAFNATNQVVTLQRADGKTGNMPLNALSEEDQHFIRSWAVTNDFMNGIGIAVQLLSKEAGDELEAPIRSNRIVKDFHYIVQLKNRSTSSFEKLEVEYCIFYRQGERDGSTINYDEGTCYGKIKVEPLAPGSTLNLETKPVRLYSQSGAMTIFGQMDSLSTADIRGIWLRLKMKPSPKTVLERAYRTSDDEIWKWTAYSIGAGMNSGSTGYQFLLQ